MGDQNRDKLELSPEASEELQKALSEPGADTPERRGMFARMKKTAERETFRATGRVRAANRVGFLAPEGDGGWEASPLVILEDEVVQTLLEGGSVVLRRETALPQLPDGWHYKVTAFNLPDIPE